MIMFHVEPSQWTVDLPFTDDVPRGTPHSGTLRNALFTMFYVEHFAQKQGEVDGIAS